MMELSTIDHLEQFVKSVQNFTLEELKDGFTKGESIVATLNNKNIDQFMEIYKISYCFSPTSFSNVKSNKDLGNVLYSVLSFRLLLKTYISLFNTISEASISGDINFLHIALLLTESDVNFHQDFCLICYSIMQLIEFNKLAPVSFATPNIEMYTYTNHPLCIVFVLKSLQTMKPPNVVNYFYHLISKKIANDISTLDNKNIDR